MSVEFDPQTIRMIGAAVHFWNYVVLKDTQPLAIFVDEAKARFYAEDYVERNGGSVRVAKIIGDVRAKAESQ